jgi:hypothetical protein
MPLNFFLVQWNCSAVRITHYSLSSLSFVVVAYLLSSLAWSFAWEFLDMAFDLLDYMLDGPPCGDYPRRRQGPPVNSWARQPFSPNSTAVNFPPSTSLFENPF